VALNTTPIMLMGTVSKMEDLKRKAVGITRYGSNTDISARFAIRKAGLQPEKDVALVQLEGYLGIYGRDRLRPDCRRRACRPVHRCSKKARILRKWPMLRLWA
jgi:hypothetical protein